MHIIIAGAARAGKTTLSVMLNKYGYTHYKMDFSSKRLEAGQGYYFEKQ